ncbi:MAG: ABC transporter ATP-binding protein [Syntrophomonadaceae bacterium]|nr:ABC transporter ATP-binding protein [Syntrophomonadaceae bacterium]MDD3890075.1 ABC transporter ATP-binding protein [Syntrophomonadaceae bacterium]MDD4548702.1 ABC transporter ATP-binding protein [Syntrophomonadaceae bacterium]
MAELKVLNVSKTLDTVHTLSNLSLQLGNNEFAVVLGPSGCGKSTLLNIISGLIRPDQGKIEIDGEDWTGRTGRTSYMQQKDLLLPSRNILDNVAIPLLLKGINKKEARKIAAQYLKDFGLEGFASYYPRQLSGGMRQRAALLRTYLFSSDILLLDEPFASLDAITRRKMHFWLMELRQRYQPSVLFVTHDIEEALLLADKIFVLSARPATVRLEINMSPTAHEHEQVKKQILSILENENNK